MSKSIVISSIPGLSTKQEAGMLQLLTDIKARGYKAYFYSQYHSYESLNGFVIKKVTFVRVIYKYYYFKALYLINKAKWIARIRMAWEIDNDREAEIYFIQRIKEAIKYLCMTRPAMFVCWNPNCWELGIMAEVAHVMGIKTGGIEWGLLPDTFIFDNQGTLASSEIFNHAINYPDDDLVAREGRLWYNKLKNESISLYKQQVKELPKPLLKKENSQINVLLLGIDILDSAAYPANHPDRKALLPFHHNSYEQAMAFAQSNASFTVIYKSHPSRRVFDDDTQVSENLWVINTDPDRLIDWADVVVCTGSKMELSVLLKNKPLVNVGAGLLYNKGCSYQVEAPGQLSQKVMEAYSNGVTNLQLSQFQKVLGYLKHYYLYSYAENSNNEPALNRFLNRLSGK